MQPEATLDWGSMAMALAGGLALFLFGMEQLTTALKAAAGARLKDVLARLTRSPATGALTGALITAVIQSSSVTTVLVVGFVSAGLMGLPQAIGVIMGANVGTTVTAQIVAFKVTDAALLLIAAGFALSFAARRADWRQYGAMTMGVGLVFYGMGVMSDGMTPLRGHAPFIDLMVELRQPLLGMAAGALFTALVQSSSATTGIVIVLASQGFVSLEAGIALALGANVGTCVTAVLSSLGKSREAQRAAAVHVLFNLGGALLWLLFIEQLAGLAVWLSPAHPELHGLARLAAETPRQVANANTVFNLLTTLLCLPFSGVLARLVERWLPDRTTPPGPAPRYLDEALIDTPTLALQRARMELSHLGELVDAMFDALVAAAREGGPAAADEVERQGRNSAALRAALLDYLDRIRRSPLSEEESLEMGALLRACLCLEQIAGEIDGRLLPLVRTTAGRVVLPADSARLFVAAFAAMRGALREAVRAASAADRRRARAVRAGEALFRRRVEGLLLSLSRGIGQVGDTSLDSVRRQMQFLEAMRRIHTLGRRLSETVADPEPGTAA